MIDIVGGILLVVGSAFTLLAGVGAVRFSSIYARMHAAAKAPALGIILIGTGTVLSVRTISVALIVVLVIVLQLIAGPVGAHMVGHSIYEGLRPDLDDVDELADSDDDEASER